MSANFYHKMPDFEEMRKRLDKKRFCPECGARSLQAVSVGIDGEIGCWCSNCDTETTLIEDPLNTNIVKMSATKGITKE